jgi:hypothetical protein
MVASGNYITESDIDNWPVSVEATEDFETTAVDISTDKITVVNDIATCTELKFSSTGAVPSPLIVGTVYYAINVDATHIKVATTPVNAAAGTAVDLTDVGSATHTLDIGSGSSETERQEVIDSVEHLIENLTKDYFYEKDFVIYRDGNGKDKLYLGLTANILSVSEVLLFGVELSSSWYTFDNDSIYLDPDAATGDELPELLLRMRYETNLFPKGTGNVKVTGTYGWASCPAAIKRAAVILCRYENDETLYTKYDDFVSEKLGDMTQSRGDKKYLTGIQEADRILRNYIRRKPMFGVA